MRKPSAWHLTLVQDLILSKGLCYVEVVKIQGYSRMVPFHLYWFMVPVNASMLIANQSPYLQPPIDTNHQGPYLLFIQHTMSEQSSIRNTAYLRNQSDCQQFMPVPYSLIVNFIHNNVASNYLLKI